MDVPSCRHRSLRTLARQLDIPALLRRRKPVDIVRAALEDAKEQCTVVILDTAAACTSTPRSCRSWWTSSPPYSRRNFVRGRRHDTRMP
ncbi:MAG: hypothetical protein ACLT2T_09450 [Bilophila wadsworthia]